MLFYIQHDSDVPINDQIVTQITFGIASGVLEQGALIPSVRDLAGQLVVHPNTVAKAYQKLEQQGVITARRGKGMEVTAGATAVCRKQRQEKVREVIREALHQAASSALPAEEVRQLVEEELARVNGQKRPREKG